MRSERNGNMSEVPAAARTQDRISIMYQFMNLAPGQELVTLPMSNGKQGRVLHLPAGGRGHARHARRRSFDTLHYERVTASPKESQAQVWLAKDHFNFPVRVVFDDTKGLRLEQTLVALRAH